MSSHNPEQGAPFSYMVHVHAHWNNEIEPQSYLNNTAGNSNVVDYADSQNDANVSSFSVIALSSLPDSVPSLPLHTPFNAQPSAFPHPFPDVFIHPIPRDSSLMQSYSHRHLSAEVISPSFFVSASTIAPVSASTSTSTPAVLAPAIIIDGRAKFPCLFCGKMCTSRPRAWTCMFNHVDAKPFACNGACGIVGW
jgi:hypothetical protein